MSIDIGSLPEEAQKALELFQEFQISEFNETGANGYVMIGRHNVLKKDVAIKVYFHEATEIDQEPAVIVSINHPNVLKVYDARKVEENCSFYMMQSANSGDLVKFLSDYNISLSLSHRLLCQLLSGLSSLHCEESKLVHRDLKPENLLVHDDTMVIADFGSVRKVDEATGQAPASRHSILYRPPESFGDNAFYDYSSDVYQAGINGYLLFGGELSNDLLFHLTKIELRRLEALEKTGDGFVVSTFVDSCIEKRIKAGKILDWSSLPFFVSNQVKRVLKAAVSSHEKRYRNVSEFLSELARIKASLPEWICTEDGYELQDWKGNDYLLVDSKGALALKKRRHGGKSFRTDNSVTGASFPEIYENLRKKIKLP